MVGVGTARILQITFERASAQPVFRIAEPVEGAREAKLPQTIATLPVGYWKLGGATNASMEGFNAKVRWLIKPAYGFRDFKYFRLKIFDLPSTDIRKRL